MNITKRSKEEAPHPRVMTGFYSLDWALASRQGIAGFPMKSIVEITGGQGVGKTTVGLSLCGIVAEKYKHNFTLIDFERQSDETVEECLKCAGFTGNVDWVSYHINKKGEEATPEEILDVSTTKSYLDNPDVILIDSLGAFKPSAIHDGDLGAANMGRQAKVLSDWFARTLRPLLLANNPSSVMFTNHQHPRFDVQKKSVNMPTPMQSSGGVGVGYYSTQSLILKKLYGFDHINYGGYTLEGKVGKNRDGFGIESKKVFYLYLMAGEGINKNLTAVMDCVMSNLAKSSATGVTESSTISIDGNKVGQFRDMIAERHNDDLFLPFHNALKSVSGGIKEVSTTLGE